MNIKDAPLCDKQREEFVALFSACRCKAAEFFDSWQSILDDERSLMIERGEVAKWDPPTSEDAVKKAASDLLTSMRMTGKPFTIEQAMEEIRRVGVPPPIDLGYVRTDRGVFLLRDFRSLPMSQSLFDQMKYLVQCEICLYASWFESNGLVVDHGAIDSLLGRLQALQLWQLFQ